jgi:hypothetical protein
LLLLAQGYSWAGEHLRAFETASLALSKVPHSVEHFRIAGLYAWNAFGHNLVEFAGACDGFIARGHGPPAFWCLLKADEYLSFATGEHELQDYEWSPGDLIPHPELLEPASRELEAALTHDPGLRESEPARGWVGDWNTRFAAVLEQPAFNHLVKPS